jgi:hypothetical protein
MTTMLRQMLAATGQPAGLPLWITELGAQTAVTPDPKADRHQMSSDLVGHHLRHIDVGENIGLWVQVAERFDHLLSAAHSHQPIMNDGDFHIDRSQPAARPERHIGAPATIIMFPRVFTTPQLTMP